MKGEGSFQRPRYKGGRGKLEAGRGGEKVKGQKVMGALEEFGRQGLGAEEGWTRDMQ